MSLNGGVGTAFFTDAGSGAKMDLGGPGEK